MRQGKQLLPPPPTATSSDFINLHTYDHYMASGLHSRVSISYNTGHLNTMSFCSSTTIDPSHFCLSWSSPLPPWYGCHYHCWCENGAITSPAGVLNASSLISKSSVSTTSNFTTIRVLTACQKDQEGDKATLVGTIAGQRESQSNLLLSSLTFLPPSPLLPLPPLLLLFPLPTSRLPSLSLLLLRQDR